MLYTGSVFKVYLLIVVSKLSNKRLMIYKNKSTAPAIMRIIYNYFSLKMKTSTNT
jgi:predicted secreted Zn-dependent protease